MAPGWQSTAAGVLGLVSAALGTAFPVAGASGQKAVSVGGYTFEPYVEIRPDGEVSGLAPALIELLNDSQDSYEFRLFVTAPARRYGDFEAGRFDIIFFESPDWGWTQRGLPVEATEVFLTDSEVFIARAEPGRFQSYFWNLEGKSVAGMLGYHYAFAGYEDDPIRLEEDFGMLLVHENAASIALARRGRVDIAVVTGSFLRRQMTEDPSLRDELLVSEIPDQIYEHRALVRRGSRPSPGEIDALLQRLEREGALEQLWREAGIAP